MRILLVLLTVLLFAGQVGGAPIEIVETETVSCLVDDDVVVTIVEPTPAQPLPNIRALAAAVSDVPAVAPTRVFRPPRRSFA